MLSVDLLRAIVKSFECERKIVEHSALCVGLKIRVENKLKLQMASLDRNICRDRYVIIIIITVWCQRIVGPYMVMAMVVY